MQIVRVSTQRGWVVLGSDSAHFYANLEPGRPFPIFDDLAAYVEAQRTALKLASSPQHFIPGHDPLVLARYPNARDGLDGVARLEVSPRA
jgi:glyoxylase-like metal-dependent hydrolase (beta-lactamase superfamily II)